MGWARAALALVALGAVAAVLVSGGSEADPRTPPGLPGMPPPFLGTAVVGEGELTAAVDAYGDVVDLRAPGPAGRALIDNRADRQAAETVPVETGIVPWVRVGGEALPPWRADSVAQRYLPGTNVVRTVARFGRVQVEITTAARGQELAMVVASGPLDVQLRVTADLACEREQSNKTLGMVCSPKDRLGRVIPRARRVIAQATVVDQRWLGRSRPLGQSAPPWAERMYEHSLLVLRALTDRRTGAVAAGARDGWTYVWPRDAGTVALAFKAAGHPTEARRTARFLLDLDLSAAARFDGKGQPVAGRGPQGDAPGWVAVAARAAGLHPPPPRDWRNLPDYQESSPGNYLANAIASTADGPKSLTMDDKSARRRQKDDISAHRLLFRRLGDPASGLDSAAAWAVEPFALPQLYPQARETMLRLVRGSSRFGITPGTAWHENDPWSAPTAWTAWSLAALGERRSALRLMTELRRSATPAGALPERVDARTGIPRSTTPLAWSHALAVLALRELWPTR
jgi:glucoamylase